MVRILILSNVFALLLTVSFAKAEILFEGYSKIISGGVHVGYIINRYEYDAKKKQFSSISFLKTNELGGNITESLRALAGDDLKPISYSYTTLIGGAAKTIDAQFEKNKMLATVKDGEKIEKISKDLPKGTFLSTFLVYVMLKSPQGLKPDTKYEYQAIAEEDAAIQKGMAMVKTLEDVNGLKALRVLNEFKNTKFISYVSERGEVFSTKSPVQGIATELMAQPSLATGNFGVPSSLLINLFGSVPTGVTNEVSKKAQQGPSGDVGPQEPLPGKQKGIPPSNKGILLKSGQPKNQETAPAESPAPTPEKKKGN
ncbi:MAG: hypothetical protein BroJett040_18640 [Oligoflexia bacterium]|nr:MAG: hypothetical protein BroJett040_18640 [Oligoflexia bacterium]